MLNEFFIDELVSVLFANVVRQLLDLSTIILDEGRVSLARG